MKANYLLFAAVPALFVSCENPADKTTSASVSDAVEKSPETAEGGTKYVFTSASEIKFVGSKVTGKHDGGFKSFTGYFTVKDGEPVGTDHKVSIDMSSVYSDSDKLTGHLKSGDFFEIETYPTSTFDVTGFSKNSDTSYTVSGNFTLRGVTKNISFPATVSKDGNTVKITSEFDINRKDFNVVYAGMPDDLIRDEVVIHLNLVAEPEA